MLEWENKQTWNKLQTMGQRSVIPYALYQVKGYISAHLAQDTGFGEEDLELLWSALQHMFEVDRSAVRGVLTSRALFIFKHVGTDRNRQKRARQAVWGCAPAHRLVENGRCFRCAGGTCRSRLAALPTMRWRWIWGGCLRGWVDGYSLLRGGGGG